MFAKANKIWSPIGLDIGRRRVRAVQLAGSPRKPQLANILMMDRIKPGGAFDIEEAVRLREVLDRKGFTGNHIVLAALPDHAMSVVMDLPPRSSGAPLHQIAGAELARTHRRSPEGLEVAFWDLPRPTGKKIEGEHVMAVGCLQQEADQLLDVLESQDFYVIGLDMQCWAIVRACRPMIISRRGIIAVVNISWNAVTFTLLHSGVVVYERQLSGCDLDSLVSRIAQDFKLKEDVVQYLLFQVGLNDHTDDRDSSSELYSHISGSVDTYYESFTQELKLSMSYVEHQYPDDEVVLLMLTGMGAAVPGLPEYLSQAIETDTHAVKALDLIDCRQATADEMQSTALTTAIGLALYDEKGVY